ncbi:MAG: hypothetical protein ABJD53_10780 [Gammaproteobacteria bacterium]
MREFTSRLVLIAALLAALSGCLTPSSRLNTTNPAPPSAAAPAPVDPSFDWHVLVIAPFGSVLKEVPGVLHEVLLFRDQDPAKDPAKNPGAATSEDGECYSADTPPPKFVGHIPEEFMLCFKQDRLARIQATVRLPEADASEVFAAACSGWLNNTATPDATAISDPATVAAPRAATCEGRDGAVHFIAHFEQEPQTALSIVLDGAGDP